MQSPTFIPLQLRPNEEHSAAASIFRDNNLSQLVKWSSTCVFVAILLSRWFGSFHSSQSCYKTVMKEITITPWFSQCLAHSPNSPQQCTMLLYMTTSCCTKRKYTSNVSGSVLTLTNIHCKGLTTEGEKNPYIQWMVVLHGAQHTFGLPQPVLLGIKLEFF